MKVTKPHITSGRVTAAAALLLTALTLGSCSMTKGIPDDDQLFAGLKKIEYADERKYDDDALNEHLASTKEELEAALDTKPNGSLFGSSYYTGLWSWHLWVYNRFAGKESAFAKWMVKSFGKPPVLMSQVNPALRASVARSVLQNNGFFRGSITYETIPKRNPKKRKIAYTVRLDSLFTLDSVAYVNFPAPMRKLIDSTAEESLIRRDEPFSLTSLDGERTRVSTLMRNNGYYFYNPGFASYLADTLAVDDKAQLRLQLADGLPAEALRKWYIGNIDVMFRHTNREQLNDSVKRRHLTIHFNGKKPLIRPGVVLKDIRMRPRQQYSYEKYMESSSLINSTGVFSTTEFQFKPRTDCDTLDLTLNCVFDKPYDFYIEGNMMGHTSGRYGPQAKIGFSKRNAFRAGEKIDINLHGAYEWSTSGGSNASNYQYGADASIEFPRLLIPFYNPDRVRRDSIGRRIRRRRFYATPFTYAKVSTDIVRRPDYYKMHIVSGEWTYRWQTSETRRHELSPLTVKYQYMNSHTLRYDSVVEKNPYLERTMGDYFIPKMRYTYTYTSPQQLRNPIRWETTIEESSNLVSVYDMIAGRKFDEVDKKLFKNPYAQFVRLESDLTKTWALGQESSLVGHLNAGVMVTYGNSDHAPYSEEFYAGGANSIRAFSVRGVGPGSFDALDSSDKQLSYLMRNGDMKFVANLEYRMPLFGNLKGAAFLDMGNIWRLRHMDIGSPEDYPDQYDGDTVIPGELIYEVIKQWTDRMLFKPSRFFEDLAIGTGIGLRYDLGFLVIRVDWGVALHLPNQNGVAGYFFNAERFSDMHTLHFAVGYPF